MEDPAIPSVAKVQGEVHDGPARANQTGSSALHWKLPPKLTQSPARWRTRQFPHNLVCPWIVLRLRRNLRSAVIGIHTLQGIYLHSYMYALHVTHSHRCRYVLLAGYLQRYIHALHMTNNSRRVPPFQPIGDRTTFKIKPRLNIQTPSIKGVV